MTVGSTGHEGAGPLQGVRVVELASIVMAPLACQILGDLGADVVKVEASWGDHSRVMGGGPHPQLSGVALNLHRNKRSIGLDIKDPEGRDVLLSLLDTADVFVTNFRPKALRKLGLLYEDVAPSRPRLVYCEAHGQSLASGKADDPAYDDIVQASSGLPSLAMRATGSVNYLPTIVGDKVAGLTIVYGVLAALLGRASTGRGGHVEVPMFDSVLAFTLVEHLARATVPGGDAGYNRLLNPFRRPHRTKDGYVAFLPYSDESWRLLYETVGRAEELNEPYFLERLQHPEEVYSSLAGLMLTRTTAEWLQLAEDLGIPAGPVPDIQEVVEDPELHSGVIADDHHPVVGEYRRVLSPVRLADHVPPSRPAPLLGQDSRSVLLDLGVSAERLEGLVSRGIVTPSATVQ